jgi:hypothetical protein
MLMLLLERGIIRIHLRQAAARVRPSAGVWRHNEGEQQRELGVSPGTDVEEVLEVAPPAEVEGVEVDLEGVVSKKSETNTETQQWRERLDSPIPLQPPFSPGRSCRAIRWTSPRERP